MRKVSATIAKAFMNGKAATVGNTRTDGTMVWLHNNVIAVRHNDTILLSLCGWNTSTTRERLNGICEFAINARPFSQRNFEPLFNGKEISSCEWVTITPLA